MGGVTDVALATRHAVAPDAASGRELVVRTERIQADKALIVGMVMDSTASALDRARKEVALKRLMMIEPMLHGHIKTRIQVDRHAASLQQTAGTLYRWLRAYKLGGIQAIAGPVRKDKGEARTYIGDKFDTLAHDNRLPLAKLAEITKQMIDVVRGLWAQNIKNSDRQVSLMASAHLCQLATAAGMPESVARAYCRQEWAVPRRFVKAERQYHIICLADRDSKGFYDLVCTSVSRTRAQLEPGDVVFGDVSPCDIPIKRPDGTQAWARLIAWRDAATNLMHVTGFLAEKGAGVRREHVALSFAHMCQHSPWGLPKRLYLDNGSEYNWDEMINSWRALTLWTGQIFSGTWSADYGLDEVGKVWRTEPYKPRAKLIESGFSQLLWALGWHPCFAGSDRMTKKTRALGKPIDATDQADVTRFVGEAVQYYNSIPQQGRHMQGRSPIEVMGEFQLKGFKKVEVEAEALALSFSDAAMRKVHAGQVTTGGWTYYAPELLAYDGVDVQVNWARHVPDAAYVFHPRTHQFICAALPMPVFGFTDVEGAKTAKKLASQACKVVEVMRGQCAWIEPRELMGEWAALSNVTQVLDTAERTARKIEVSAEGRTMLAARNAAVLAAVAKADTSVEAEKLTRLNDGETEEEAEARRLFG